LTARAVRVSQDDWHCAALCNIFAPSFYSRIIGGLEQLVWTEAIQNFYSQREVNLKGNPYFEELFSDDVRSTIIDSIGSFFGERLRSDFDIAAHKMISGDFIDVHTDSNDHNETHRMTVTLNDGWSLSDGGILLALNSGAISSVRDAWLPTANNGFVFKISESSYHAVTPILGSRPRYSLIITFKRSGVSCTKEPTWIPFVLQSDVECATATAAHMGISPETFTAPFKYSEFGTVDDLRSFVSGHLYNAPKQWSYKKGTSINVDHNGNQPKGTDADRVDAVRKLRRIPPIIVVRRKTGCYCLVDGSHRLSHAHDESLSIGVALYEEK